MDSEKKNKILNGWKTNIPLGVLVNYVVAGEVTLAELQQTIASEGDQMKYDQLQGLLSSKEEELKKEQECKDNEAWEVASREGKVASYRDYLTRYPDGMHKGDAEKQLSDLDLKMWQELKGSPSREGVEKYLSSFPQGSFVGECRAMLEDMPWYETMSRGTIAAYKEYQRMYPGKHGAQIEKMIKDIEDERDWKTACDNNSRESYEIYMEAHPGGVHRDEAEAKLRYRSGTDIFLDMLKEDINALSAYEIQTEVDNGTASWHDLERVYTMEQVEAIRNYRRAEDLPAVEAMRELPKGYTEVYFWGTRGTGKTCAIGATLGYLTYERKNIKPINCPGQKYLFQLQNMFNNRDYACKLPPGTVTGNLPAMAFTFKDNNCNDHKMMFIDVAGEVFSGIYKKNMNEPLEEKEERAIEDLTRCLNNHYNNKIHFFIIEYDNDDYVMENIFGKGALRKSQVMQSLTDYFASSRLFDKSSVGMYILVTKCDKIPQNEDRNEKVKAFINNGMWETVVRNIKDISVKAKCGGLSVLNFSIGDVFAKDLCIFKPRDAGKIVEEIEKHTHAYRDTFWSKLIDSFRK